MFNDDIVRSDVEITIEEDVICIIDKEQDTVKKININNICSFQNDIENNCFLIQYKTPINNEDHYSHFYFNNPFTCKNEKTIKDLIKD